MSHDIVGDWDVALGEQGKGPRIGRLRFFEQNGRLHVADVDADGADGAGTVSRVDAVGETLRFEHLSAGSARGTTRHTFEITLDAPASFVGTRRRGLLARIPVTGVRVIDPLDGLAGHLADTKARAAEAAERAALAAAEAAAALAEAEAAAALEAARRAAQRAVAARAAATSLGAESGLSPLVVPAELLAVIPAPAQPAATDAPAPPVASER